MVNACIISDSSSKSILLQYQKCYNSTVRSQGGCFGRRATKTDIVGARTELLPRDVLADCGRKEAGAARDVSFWFCCSILLYSLLDFPDIDVLTGLVVGGLRMTITIPNTTELIAKEMDKR